MIWYASKYLSTVHCIYEEGYKRKKIKWFPVLLSEMIWFMCFILSVAVYMKCVCFMMNETGSDWNSCTGTFGPISVIKNDCSYLFL